MIFVCFLWDDPNGRFKGRYTYNHVNRLNSMLERHTTDHSLVCVTDTPKYINPKIMVVELWDDYRDIGGNYVRLKLFDESMKGIIGERFVLMDLDCVILDNIDDLYDESEFKTMKSKHKVTPYNTGMFQLTAGTRSEVWETFNPIISLRRIAESGMIGWDQAWISLILGPNEPTWSEVDGVLNFRFDILEKKGRLSDDARIVFFPGDYDPSDEALQKQFPWIKENWG